MNINHMSLTTGCMNGANQVRGMTVEGNQLYYVASETPGAMAMSHHVNHLFVRERAKRVAVHSDSLGVVGYYDSAKRINVLAGDIVGCATEIFRLDVEKLAPSSKFTGLSGLQSVALSESALYVKDSTSLAQFDLSLRKQAEIPTLTDKDVKQMRLEGHYLYACGRDFTKIDLRNTSAALMHQSMGLSPHFSTSLAIDEGIAVVSTSDGKLYRFGEELTIIDHKSPIWALERLTSRKFVLLDDTDSLVTKEL